ncbi:MAG: tRNA 2-thiouridine(34) synthase MnmA [Candidatus Omnitrophica bacterium]|nr:tRNA 2-thiouridine(34) synthase MnmA [Candidatus Omnitrophota bacterium]
MKERVVVAMSGGVDSAVSAALLKKQGYEVIGITMCFNLPDSNTKRPTCCGIQGIIDARRVAHKLGIKHYALNFSKDLKEKVIADFCQEYLKGRTPNPCVRCNQYIKFDALLKKALSLNAKYLATGHYARTEEAPSSKLQAPSYLLKKGKDRLKDQSYFLYRLNQGQLKHVIFPIGNFTKDKVRALAREFELPVAEKLASQEICFLSNSDYRQFLKNQINTGIKPGQVVDVKGNILGLHKGIALYTIGQREGLGIAWQYRLYIKKIDYKHNRITVGKKEDAYSSEFLVKKPHFILKSIKKKVALNVKIRYNHREMLAEVMPYAADELKVSFRKSQFAITPGQSAVFYDKDTVIGGGIIETVLN